MWSNQRVAQLLLRRMGYRADLAADGQEVIDCLKRQRYDVVLMDVQMPHLDGLEATRRIRERWSGEARPRIVATTAIARPGDRERCFARRHGRLRRQAGSVPRSCRRRSFAAPGREASFPSSEPGGPQPRPETIEAVAGSREGTEIQREGLKVRT